MAINSCESQSRRNGNHIADSDRRAACRSTESVDPGRGGKQWL